MEGESPISKPPERRRSSEKNPWMYISILLAFLLIISMGINFSITASILSGGIQTGNTDTGSGAAPSQGSPQPPRPSQPAAVKVSADDDPVKGDPNAEVTIIEFSDFQCPFCGSFFRQTLPQIEQEYINTGKVKLVYRDFPLSFHPQAQPAAEAAECAKEQGKFWEFHDKIFQNQGSMSTENYKQWAADLGLDTEKFNSCLDSGKYKQEVQKDFADGSAAGVSGTPTFFIGNDKDGYQKVVGAQPYNVFKNVIDSYLS